jgi:hypothetical protein
MKIAKCKSLKIANLVGPHMSFKFAFFNFHLAICIHNWPVLRDLRGSNFFFRFQLPCRRLVGENQDIASLDKASGNRHIARAQTCER